MTKKQKAFLYFVRNACKVKTATKFVLSAIFAVTIYAIAAFIVFIVTGGNNISDSLTVAWFSFWTVEIVSLASIKNTKTKKKKVIKEEKQ